MTHRKHRCERNLGSLDFGWNDISPADPKIIWQRTFVSWRCRRQVFNDQIFTVETSIVNQTEAGNNLQTPSRICSDPKLCFHARISFILMITAYQHTVTLAATDLHTYHSSIIGKAASLPYGYRCDVYCNINSRPTYRRTTKILADDPSDAIPENLQIGIQSSSVEHVHDRHYGQYSNGSNRDQCNQICTKLVDVISHHRATVDEQQHQNEDGW